MQSRMSTRPKTPRARADHKNNGNAFAKAHDPVQVFCRLRPISDASPICAHAKNENTVVLSAPEQLATPRQEPAKEIEYMFKQVFATNATQYIVYSGVGAPLLKNLLEGRNSLLFTYGITGSGKTFTMAGDNQNIGIMRYTFEVLFRSIAAHQAKKCVFQSDHLNGFEILSDKDAKIKRLILKKQNVAHQKNELRRKEKQTEIVFPPTCDVEPMTDINEDNIYAVFVSYIEFYNNNVYDLLENSDNDIRLQKKIIREDPLHNMYVHGVTEIEIKSVEEAMNVIQIGQKRKRMACTQLNAESSRSHSVFTIRLVQAPKLCQGEHCGQDNNTITVSQLSLVDLAGSERSSRTNNTGIRLREAGNINNSLMTLRTCLEYLREKQQCGNGELAKKIPYRDSKLTNFFKNYFEGEGKVSMIICINPQIEDYAENIQVMKFAEMTQEVQIPRATPRIDTGLTPRHQIANKVVKKQLELNEIDKDDVVMTKPLPNSWIEYKMAANATMQKFSEIFANRIEKRKEILLTVKQRMTECRIRLAEMHKKNDALNNENATLQNKIKELVQKITDFEYCIEEQEMSVRVLKEEVYKRDRDIDELKRKLKENQITKNLQENEQPKKGILTTSNIAKRWYR